MLFCSRALSNRFGFRKSNWVDCEAGLHEDLTDEGGGEICGVANFARTTSRFAAVYASPRYERVRRECIQPLSRALDMGRLHTFSVTLRRDSRDVNWGLRLVGGSDLATPLIVTRVSSFTYVLGFTPPLADNNNRLSAPVPV